jgi:hypothetical protein
VKGRQQRWTLQLLLFSESHTLFVPLTAVIAVNCPAICLNNSGNVAWNFHNADIKDCHEACWYDNNTVHLCSRGAWLKSWLGSESPRLKLFQYFKSHYHYILIPYLLISYDHIPSQAIMVHNPELVQFNSFHHIVFSFYIILYYITLHYITLHSQDPQLVRMTVVCKIYHITTKIYVQYNWSFHIRKPKKTVVTHEAIQK